MSMVISTNLIFTMLIFHIDKHHLIRQVSLLKKVMLILPDILVISLMCNHLGSFLTTENNTYNQNEKRKCWEKDNKREMSEKLCSHKFQHILDGKSICFPRVEMNLSCEFNSLQQHPSAKKESTRLII